MGGLFGRLLRRRVTADAPQVPLQQLDPRERAAWEERWRRERHERLARNRRARRWRPLRIAGQWMLRAFFALVAVLSAVFGEYGMAVYALSVLVLYSMDFAVFGAAARRDERLLRLYRGLSVVLLALGAWTVGRLLWGWLTTR